MKRLLAALIIVGLMAVPAFASVQNVKVSGSIDSTWVVRDGWDLGHDSVAQGTATPKVGREFYQNLLITTAILRVDADLTDNVSAVIQLINEREWGDGNSTTSYTDNNAISGGDTVTVNNDGNLDIDIDLAYVVLREMLYSPLTVTIGRQILKYNDDFIIGSGRLNSRLTAVASDLSKKDAFDAVKMVLDYDPLTVDVFVAKVDANQVTGLSGLGSTSQDDDVDLYGINANYELGDQYNTVVDAFFFANIDNTLKNSGDYDTADTIYAPGFKVATTPIEGLNASLQLAWQFGNDAETSGANTKDNLRRQAMAAQLLTTYALPLEVTAKYNPVISNSYTYLSGDSDPDEKGDIYRHSGEQPVNNAWNPMYEDQSTGRIYDMLFQASNCHIYSSALTVEPFEDITTALSWTGLWLDRASNEAATDEATTLIMPDGTTITTMETELTRKYVGSEFDLDISYDYTEDVEIGFSAGWFFPGTFFDEDNDDTASQFLTSVNVAF